MIRHLHIENFRCLRDVTIELGAFTVLVGANDSGKSSILDAIQLLGRTTEESVSVSLSAIGQSEPAPLEALVWRRDVSQRIVLDALGRASKDFAYHLELHQDTRLHTESLTSSGGLAFDVNGRTGTAFALTTPQEDISVRMREDSTALRSSILQNASDIPDLVEIARGFGSSVKYDFDAAALRRPSQPVARPALSASGDNLAAVLDALLTGPDRSAVQALEAALREAVPTLAGIALRTITLDSGRVVKTVEFPLAGGGRPYVTIPASQASEGALLLTAFLALAQGSTPEILLIEDPGRGLHPTRIRILVDLLRRISRGDVGGRPRQVIVATHSPILLNYVTPDEVRLVQRDPERGTSVTSMADIPNIGQLLVGFHVGEVWAQLAEDGLLKQGP